MTKLLKKMKNVKIQKKTIIKNYEKIRKGENFRKKRKNEKILKNLKKKTKKFKKLENPKKLR